MATRAPPSASCFASSAPIPDDAPTMIALVPMSLRGILVCFDYGHMRACGDGQDGDDDKEEDGDEDVGIAEENVGGFAAFVIFKDSLNVAGDAIENHRCGEDDAGIGFCGTGIHCVEEVGHAGHSGKEHDEHIEGGFAVFVERFSGRGAIFAHKDKFVASFCESEGEGEDSGDNEHPSRDGDVYGLGPESGPEHESGSNYKDVDDRDVFELDVVKNLDQEIDSAYGEAPFSAVIEESESGDEENGCVNNRSWWGDDARCDRSFFFGWVLTVSFCVGEIIGDISR